MCLTSLVSLNKTIEPTPLAISLPYLNPKLIELNSEDNKILSVAPPHSANLTSEAPAVLNTLENGTPTVFSTIVGFTSPQRPYNLIPFSPEAP